ncbi:hypothetical protein [Micromonospora chersina]|uniref:hypothetical protein n=1 Tax=Micromonospora chersina TaxID=47854 RepID=UPI00371E0F5D
MEFAKGDRVVLTRADGEHKAGSRGRVIRVETAFFASTKYSVLLDDSGEVVEQLKDADLFRVDQD